MSGTHTISGHRTTWVLLAIAALSIAGHCLVNNRYGFHRDELPVIDDARHLAWGYVVYPPVTPFVARVALACFGTSLVGLRFFSALGFAIAIVLAGMMARELGARPFGQTLAAAAVAIAPVPIHNASLFQYVTFDYLAWVLTTYFVLRLCRSGNPRWWLAIGASISFGMLSKYTMGVLVVGLVTGVLLTPIRRDLRNRWLWLGALLSLALFLPNLIWQVQHHFVTLYWFHDTHVRDLAEGRSNGFLKKQLLVGANLMTIPLWLAGLWFYFFSRKGQPYRILGWMYLVPLILFIVLHGRSYYLAPAYPMLLAAGSYCWSGRFSYFKPFWRTVSAVATLLLILLGGLWAVRILMPVATINSDLFRKELQIVDDFAEEIGWPELVDSVAKVYRAQTAAGHVVILCGNYGEAGAIDLYGPSRGLPGAISGANSYWPRGYGNTAPDTVILVGFNKQRAERYFIDPVLASHIGNAYGVTNEESKYHADIFVCHQARLPWPLLWAKLRDFE